MRTGGPTLPYHIVAGVAPCRAGWLVASCKIAGVTLSVEEPVFFQTLIEILDNKPAYEVIGVHAPIGYLDQARPGGRTCDREARAKLGPRRGASIRSAPSRAFLRGETEEGIDAVTRVLMPQYRQIAAEIAPYRQRTVYEVEPELTFFELNDQTPLSYSKHSGFGRDERRAILERRIDGVGRVLTAELPYVDPARLIDAVACMWTARRIIAKTGTRIPEEPEWDSEGMRMEIIY